MRGRAQRKYRDGWFWLLGLGCLVGLLVWPRFGCLVWLVAWMDGKASSFATGALGVWFAWFVGCSLWWVCWLGRVVAWLVGRLVGTPLMDAWMDGCCVNGEGAAPPLQCKPSLPRTGFLVSTALGENTELCGLVAWFVGCLLAWPRCCLVGWSVGWHSVDGMDAWMDGMDPVLPHVPEASGSVSGGSRRSGQSLRSFRRVPKG